jgi:hypothetical protein
MPDIPATGHHPIETEIEDLPAMEADTPRGLTKTSGLIQSLVAFLPESLQRDRNPLPIRHVVHRWGHRQLRLPLHAMTEAEGLPDVVRQRRCGLRRR